ncbi:MAG TPA: immunoglobulin domain-containing protein [Candidatus Paceibacterota bacterium]|nr:immunoglobulin domain-containing protein [Candidatus Paceibacterota bacterium]
MATINDFGEDQWIQRNFSSYGGVGRELWIGLHDLDPMVNSTNLTDRSHEFEWSSGLMSDLHKWPSPGEPNTNPATTEFYVVMLPPAQHASWADRSNTYLTSGLVEVPRPLEIVSQPKSHSVRIGGSVQISVATDGTSPVRYQWQFMGTNLRGATTSSLRLMNAQPAQSGPYRVVVNNGEQILTSATAFVSVAGIVGWGLSFGAVFDAPPSATNLIALAAGQAHGLGLRSDGTVVGWGSDWQGATEVPLELANVVAISAGDRHSLALQSDGRVVEWGEMVGDRPRPKDLPNVVAIAAGASFNLVLLRDGALHLTVQPWDQSVAFGSTSSFSAKAVGGQSMSYQWQLNGADIEGATEDTYLIVNAQPADAGDYSVAISNSLGAMISRKAKLAVLPRVTVLTNCFEVNAGQSVTFTNDGLQFDPSRRLTFSLVTSPEGATIHSETGVFSWRPPVSAAGTTHRIEFEVADDTTPPVSARWVFFVVVNQLQPVRLTPELMADGHFVLRFSGAVGPDYILEASDNLIRWNSLQTACPLAMPFVFTPPNSNSISRRFYRVRLAP